jgi:hypothetical protein
MRHPDEAEAIEWVSAEIARLRSLSYDELAGLVDEALHYRIVSRTGRVLMGEAQVFWERDEHGPLWLLVDICERKPGVVSSIASDQFLRAADEFSDGQ